MKKNCKLVQEAFVHGRFQPFHKQHLEYIKIAIDQSFFLWIGITNFEPKIPIKSPNSPHRELLISNPLTYFERIRVIVSALEHEGVLRDEYSFIPMPIENPERILNFISPKIKCFTTICNNWNLHKIKVFKNLGFEVEVLLNRQEQQTQNIISGSDIRKKILAKNSSWRHDVPSGALKILDELKFENKLNCLNERV